MKKVTFILFAILSMTIGFAQTETLAEWTPATMPGGANDFGTSPFAASTTADNLVVGGLTRGSGIGTTGSGAQYGWGGNDFIATSATEAVTENEFVTFTITADTGYTFSIESIEPYNIRRSGTGPTTGQWQYQIGEGSFTDIGSAITWGSTTTNVGNNQPAIDLSEISDLQDIDAGTMVTFRLLLWGATGTGGTWYFNGHNNATNKTLTVLGLVEEDNSTSGYCIPTAETNSGTHGIITNVTFNGINNSTTDNEEAYQDYTSISTTVVQGDSYELSVTTEAGGMMFATWSKAWIDWNNDNIFDSDEEYDLGTGASVNTTIQIPADALGEYRLRVRTYSQNSMLPFGFVTPCDNLNSSEAEDYTIIVEEESGSTPLTYCQINEDYWDVEEITSVVFGDNTTISNTNNTDILVDFTSTVADVEQGESYTITVKGNSYGGYDNEYVAFIDWNQNGILDDAGEVYYIGLIYSSTGYDSQSASAIITVPTTALTGETRIRITKTYTDEYYDLYLNIDPCYISIDEPGWGIEGSYGQALDFTINVLIDNPCAGIEAPMGDTAQEAEMGDTLADLDVTATGTITWYSDSDLTTIIPDTTEVVDGTTYYATNTEGDCESEMLAVTVTITVIDPCTGIEAPMGDAAQEAEMGDTLADLDVTATGTLTWYSDSDLTTVIPDTTEVVDGVTYWVTNTEGDCESEALVITVTISVIDPCTGIEAPMGDAAQEAEMGDTLADLDVTATGTITWYADEDLMDMIPDSTELVDGTTYYATNTEGDCESEALAVTVTVIEETDPCEGTETPMADSPQTMTEGQMVSEIVVTATGTLTWYADEDLTTEVNVTEVLSQGSYTFWVTQTIGDCTSEAIQIEVEVTLSTNEFDQVSFKAYPNPVKDLLTVSYNKDITNITVVNMIGQILMTKPVNTTDTQIDMTSLPIGNYFVKVVTEGAVKTVKVVKQ